MRLVTVNDLGNEQVPAMAKVLHSTQLCSDLRVLNLTSISMITGEAREQVQAQFKVTPTNLNQIIKVLNANGYSTFDVSALLATTEDVPNERVTGFLAFLYRRVGGSRISTLEMHTNIKGSVAFTFDHGLLIVLACFLSAYGLLMDSPVNILAAFFVSPLMNMILGAAWGFVIQDYNLVLRGLKNVACGACLAWSLGVAVASMVIHFDRPMFMKEHDVGEMTINSQQILSRGPPASLTLGGTAIIASLSGITIALGQSTGVASALAGVTMAASLLPPLVNSGMCALMGWVYPDVRTSNGDSLFAVAAVSLGIYTVTVPLVMFFAYVVFKFKHIGGRSLFMGSRENSAELERLSVWSTTVGTARSIESTRSGQEVRNVYSDGVLPTPSRAVELSHRLRYETM